MLLKSILIRDHLLPEKLFYLLNNLIVNVVNVLL
jgi:hypothetical protein